MPDKTEPKDLEVLLAKLRQEWQELADLLTSQGKSQDRVIEVEKILLRDASGQYRGKISANPDGSADLLLSDRAGNAWARLGVNQAGEAFLELKDRQGESSLKTAVGSSSPGDFAGPSAAPADAPNPAVPQSLESPGASPLPIMPAEAGGEALGESGSVSPDPTHDSGLQSGRDANSAVLARVDKLRGQYRRLKFIGAIILGVFGVILATQAYVLFRPHPPGLQGRPSWFAAQTATSGPRWALPVNKSRWTCGTPRATAAPRWGCGAEGAPRLAFYDRNQLVRAELNLGPDGEPKFILRDKRNLQGKTEKNVLNDSGNQKNRRGTASGSEEGTVARPPASQAEALPPTRDAEAEIELFGSKPPTSTIIPPASGSGGLNRRV